MLIKLLRYLLVLYFLCFIISYIYSWFTLRHIEDVGNTNRLRISEDGGGDTDGLKLVIGSIGISEDIDFESNGTFKLKKHLQHLPYTPLPGMGGNIVIVGHRIDYSSFSPPPFFYLDRVQVGDMVELVYMGEIFLYEVIIKEVVKNDEKDYEYGILEGESVTLYTCTPVLNPINRLVVVGKVVSND